MLGVVISVIVRWYSEIAGSTHQTRLGAFFIGGMSSPWCGGRNGCNRHLRCFFFGLVHSPSLDRRTSSSSITSQQPEWAAS